MKTNKLRRFRYTIITWKPVPGKDYLERTESTTKTHYALTKRNALAELKAKYPNKTIVVHGIKKTVLRPKTKTGLQY